MFARIKKKKKSHQKNAFPLLSLMSLLYASFKNGELPEMQTEANANFADYSHVYSNKLWPVQLTAASTAPKLCLFFKF